MKKYDALKSGERVIAISFLVNVLVFIMEIIVGTLSNSVSLTADAIHTATDSLGVIAVFLGLRIAQRKPNERFPYGYYKAENIGALVVAFIILLTTVDILIDSFEAILHPRILNIPIVALIVAAIGTVVSYLLSYYKGKTGCRINSQSLIAEAEHSRVDVFATGLVFVGILVSYLGFPIVEAIAGFIVAIFVAFSGIEIAKDSLLVLMDACTDSKLPTQLQEFILQHPKVDGVHFIKIRRAGPFLFVDAHLELSPTFSVNFAHEICDELEEKIKSHFPNIESVNFHVEPGTSESTVIAVPVNSNNARLDDVISEHFSRAPYYLIIRLKHNDVVETKIIENPAKDLPSKKGLKIAKALVDMKVSVAISKNIGEITYYALNSLGILIYKTSLSTVKEIINAFINKKLSLYEHTISEEFNKK